MSKAPLFTLLALGLTFCTQHGYASASPKQACGAFGNALTVDVGGRPESVLWHSDLILASNMGKGTREQKGDGYVSLLGAEGQVVDPKWLPVEGDQLDSPLGMAVLGRTLYVADINRIAAFDLDTRKALEAIDLSASGATFLNDVVAGEAPYIFVSATAIKKVFRVNTATGEFASIADGHPDLSVPNGLAWSESDKHLYVAQNQVHSIPKDGQPNGSVIVLDANNDFQVINASVRFARFVDGIALTSQGEVLVSDWHSFTDPGLLYRLDASLEVTGSEPIASNGFADFASNTDGKCLIAPDLMAGTVVFVPR